MRSFDWLGPVCLSGAVGVTVLANQARGKTDAPPRPVAEPAPRPLGALPPDDVRPVWATPLHAAPLPPSAPHTTPRWDQPATMEPILEAPPPRARAAEPALSAETFSNTYYDFPIEDEGPADTPLYDPSCRRIALVSRAFHDQVCVQGSGRTAAGTTVSFAKRGCSCAELCPRTAQHVCYEALDPARFPNGRGATGRAITPLWTIAVDPAVIPMGTRVFIPELVGLPRPDGAPHDGCFAAEDRGLRIRGLRLDVFTGDEHTRRLWEALVPSHRGVRVYAAGARCATRASAQRHATMTVQ
jgi:3D (Asp-Asp-Asp) domain-containing protein